MKNMNQIKYKIPLCAVVVFSVLSFVERRVRWDWIYTHWLYDFHFGFMKRSLVGAIITALNPQRVLPLSIVQIISYLLWATVVALAFRVFWLIYQKCEGSTAQNALGLFFAFTLLAPVGFRNYAYDLGRFDQLGSLALLLQFFSPPALLTGVLCISLVFVHEGFIFIFLPAILYCLFLQRGLRWALTIGGLCLLATLVVVQFGKPAVNMDVFWTHLLAKADQPLDHNIELFYRSFEDQLRVNQGDASAQLPFFWGYLFYLSYLLPLILMVRRKALDQVEWAFWTLIGLGYVSIFVLTCDWTRHTANAFLTLVVMNLIFFKERIYRETTLADIGDWRKPLASFTVLSMIIPAAGVEVPRIVKLWPVVSKLLSFR